MSTRALQRLLEASGATFVQVLDDLRRHTARHLLTSTDLPAAQIAHNPKGQAAMEASKDQCIAVDHVQVKQLALDWYSQGVNVGYKSVFQLASSGGLLLTPEAGLDDSGPTSGMFWCRKVRTHEYFPRSLPCLHGRAPRRSRAEGAGAMKPANATVADTARHERQTRNSWLCGVDFDQAPFTIAWEVTRACAFSCVHCRADAQHRPDPRELSTQEAFGLIDRFTEFGSPILVFTGGDPMMRKDLFELIQYATDAGLRCSLTPTATALPTVARLRKAKEAGVRRIALSLDAPTPQIHDEFRKVDGSWQRTMDILHAARELGISTQINTTVTTHNVHLLADMVQFVQEVGAVQWSVFFLVPMGRGQQLSMISPEQHEEVLTWLHDLSLAGDFDIKATAAPMYRRIAAQRRRGDAPLAGAGFTFNDGLDRPVQGVNDGRGFLFVGHRGDITPSGFLPIVAGNVRTDDVVDVYRNHPLFTGLRDPERLTGKCGACEFRSVCGGQRGRAYAVTGDPYASDPACAYVPAGWSEMVHQ